MRIRMFERLPFVLRVAIPYSNRLVRECLVGMALREKGLTDEDYFDPIYIKHGQD